MLVQGYRLRLDLTLTLSVVTLNVMLIFAFSRLPVFSGRIGQALGCLMVVDLIVGLVCVFKKQWITSIGLCLAAILCWVVLGYG